MDLLTLIHEDFELFISCDKFEGIYGKARRNIGDEHLTSAYSWTGELKSAELRDADGELHSLESGQKAPAMFFDNAEYPIWVEFKGHVSEAGFGSALQSENDKFSFHSRRNVLSGFLNYGNEIGHSELTICYRKDSVDKTFTFSYDVLSTKLDYHEHWTQIINDIEAEYRMLSLDYMRRTFHGFSPDINGETSELIWWSIFKGEQDKFVKACKSIIERPRHRLRSTEEYLRADKLKRVPANIENELAEHRLEPNHLYRVEQQIQSNDTIENQFLKYALGQVGKKYESLRRRIMGLPNTSDVMRDEMKEMSDTLGRLSRHPFFRTISPFKGLNQESQVLQKATGYSQVYRTWNLLRRAYSLNEAMYRLQTKDIATLYEIWCFIEVSHIVRDQLHLDNTDLEQRNRMEMNGLFTWELGRGGNSRILFKKDGIELAELVYNPKHTERDNDTISMEHLVSKTVPQKPDIVLQLTKNDLQEGMKMTYLFDAKYRIDGRTNDGVDTPPDDAINQMHRYRDAIYYHDYEADALKKEVIGGYILFPGDGATTDVEVSKFYKSIAEVNIGAFPLRPKDEHNRILLEDFITGLIAKRSADTVKEVIPQKGAFVEVGDRLLIGVARRSSRKGYFEAFEDGTARLYYTGPHFPTTIALQDLHFFAPHIKGKGIRDVYEITRVRTITSAQAHENAADRDNDMRLAFELQFCRQLFPDWQPIESTAFILDTFVDTTFSSLKDILCPTD